MNTPDSDQGAQLILVRPPRTRLQTYEHGLLLWLKGEPEGPATMQAAYDGLAAPNLSRTTQGALWVVEAFFAALVAGCFKSDVEIARAKVIAMRLRIDLKNITALPSAEWHVISAALIADIASLTRSADLVQGSVPQPQLDWLRTFAALQEAAQPVKQAIAVPDPEILGLFFEEAGNLLGTIAKLESELAEMVREMDDDSAVLLEIRRNVHTLKGIARMAGQREFAESAWLLEQVLNHWISQAFSGTLQLTEVIYRVGESLRRWLELKTPESNTALLSTELQETCRQLIITREPWANVDNNYRNLSDEPNTATTAAAQRDKLVARQRFPWSDKFGLPRYSPLGAWNVYFLAKFALYWKGLIGFNAIENLTFAMFMLLPAETRQRRIWRQVLAWPVALSLLYYDSFLPPFSRLIAQSNQVANFSFLYIIELAARIIHWPTIALLFCLTAAYLLIARWVRVSSLTMIGLLWMLSGNLFPTHLPAAQTETGIATTVSTRSMGDELDAQVQDFFSTESDRRVTFRSPPNGASTFDVIFLQVCSLAWDDLKFAKLEDHPLFNRFDFMLSQFNTAASYSGPAAIRLSRATCGQAKHDDLYARPASGCYLMDGLKSVGFSPNLVLNHDGRFDDFLKFIRAKGSALPDPFPLQDAKIAQYAFDGTPIYDDRDMLERWLGARNKVDRAALYYNSISLHDGNRLSGNKTAGFSLETYPDRLKQLLDDFDAFIGTIERSGRQAIVVLIPEHGAALQGDRMQFAGLREIPTPPITLAPVGIKLVGAKLQRQGGTAVISQPTSYLAMSELVARLIASPPFDSGVYTPKDFVADLPITPFVAQNAGAMIVGRDNQYFLKQGNGAWSSYERNR